MLNQQAASGLMEQSVMNTSRPMKRIKIANEGGILPGVGAATDSIHEEGEGPKTTFEGHGKEDVIGPKKEEGFPSKEASGQSNHDMLRFATAVFMKGSSSSHQRPSSNSSTTKPKKKGRMSSSLRHPYVSTSSSSSLPLSPPLSPIISSSILPSPSVFGGEGFPSSSSASSASAWQHQQYHHKDGHQKMAVARVTPQNIEMVTQALLNITTPQQQQRVSLPSTDSSRIGASSVLSEEEEGESNKRHHDRIRQRPASIMIPSPDAYYLPPLVSAVKSKAMDILASPVLRGGGGAGGTAATAAATSWPSALGHRIHPWEGFQLPPKKDMDVPSMKALVLALRYEDPRLPSTR